MIVDPDFLDHWKTALLINSLEDAAAPLYVLRLWAHCQLRRQWNFDNLTPEALKALCRFSGPANRLESSLAASGFIRRNEGSLIVCNWEEYNATLIANWDNGRKGGRPKKTQSKPMGYPRDSHGKPTANPNETDEMGLDESREDTKDTSNDVSGHTRGKRTREPPFEPPKIEEVRKYISANGYEVDPQKWFDFYSAKGWMIGKNKMKDWRAAVRTWNKPNEYGKRTADTGPGKRFNGNRDELSL